MYTKEEFMRKYGGIIYNGMLLGRFVMDCDYYLGNGNRCVKHLWSNTLEEHLQYMVWMWEVVQPEWLTREELDWYLAEMRED